MNNKFFSTLLAVSIFSVLISISLTGKALAGMDFNLGCCVSENGTSQCVGCGEFGENCAVPQDDCLLELGGTFFQGGSFCSEGLPGAECFTGGDSFGCCVIEPGSCEDAVVVSSCGGELWLVQTSCENVPQCTSPAAEVPAISKWGIVAVAAVLGIMGFIVIRKRKAVA